MRRTIVFQFVTILFIVGLGLIAGCGNADDPTAVQVTIVVDPDPDSIDAPWTLLGPNGFNASGTGDTTLNDREPGNYTLTWGDLTGWITPSRSPHNQTAAQGGTIVFNGVYQPLRVDVVIINPEPDEIDAPWDVSGPGGYMVSGRGDSTLNNMSAGNYTLTWGNVSGWDEPVQNPNSKTLDAGSFIQFDGTYTELPPIHTITIRINPSFIDASWDLTWPSGQHTVASGDTVMLDMPLGTYSMLWSDVPSYETPQPNPAVQDLQANGSLLFLGNYSRFIRVEAGEFDMGSPGNEPGHGDDEVLHHVTLTRPFLISKTEVTQAEWKSVVPDSIIPDPSYFSDCDNCPVESVSWFEAILYCNFRSFIENYTPAYILDDEEGVLWDQDADGYRLPTEAEWEYACRATTTTAYSNGDIVFANNNPFDCYPDSVLNIVGWFCNNSENRTHQVAGKEPNPWGIFDVHGNVWEWCWDLYGEYPAGSVVDPTGADSGSLHVIRGGAWQFRAQLCRSAKRGLGTQSKTDPRPTQGFRVVRTIFE